MNRYFTRSFLLLVLAAFWGCQPANMNNGSLSLEQIRDKYGESPNAYELHSSGMGLGEAEISPATPLTVNSGIEKLTITYRPPRQGIAPGGMVSVCIPPGSTLPQLQYPDSAGYVEIFAGDGIPVKGEVVRVPLHRRPKGSAGDTPYRSHPKYYRVVEAMLPEGLHRKGRLTFTWNHATIDKFARRYEGDRLLFRVSADHDADGYAEEISHSPSVPKIADAPYRIMLRIRSTGVVGKPVEMSILALDRYNNPATSYRGKVRFHAEEEAVQLPEPYAFTPEDASNHQFRASFSSPGFYWIEAVDEESGFHASSNPVEIFSEEPEKHLYWGDLHVHTDRSSDARSDAHTTSTYEGSYLIGRYRYALDFMANTDHHNLRDKDYSAAQWEEMKQITNNANDPGHFVTFVANEISNGKGDQNIYFPGNDAPFLLTGGENHPYDLWDTIAPYECIAVPHHVAQSMRPWHWENFNPEKMPVVEIFSNHGRAEYFGNEPNYSPHPVATLEGQTWVDQLNSGKKLGAIASSDDHWARPGTMGITGVWASSFNREGIYDQIKSRHCYASTASRVILHLSVNGQEMGSSIRSREAPHIEVLAASPDTILLAEIIKDGEVAHRIAPGSLMTDISWRDGNFTGNAYYYLRLTLRADPNAEEYMQNRTQFIWSSPIWVEKE